MNYVLITVAWLVWPFMYIYTLGARTPLLLPVTFIFEWNKVGQRVTITKCECHGIKIEINWNCNWNRTSNLDHSEIGAHKFQYKKGVRRQARNTVRCPGAFAWSSLTWWVHLSSHHPLSGTASYCSALLGCIDLCQSRFANNSVAKRRELPSTMLLLFWLLLLSLLLVPLLAQVLS